MVMPRSRSCSIQSIVAAPSWTSPILWMLPGVEEDALGRRRLARVDVRDDADVARLLERLQPFREGLSRVATLMSSFSL